MPRQSALRNVVMTLSAAALIATVLPRAAIAGDADEACRQDTQAGVTPGPRPFIEISQGRMVIGSPIQRLKRFSACQLARWREPENGRYSMLAFVYNNSVKDVFRDAQLLIESEGNPAPANSLPIPIGPSGTGVFLFVGPITTIELHGKYRGRIVEFMRKGAPGECTQLTLHRALETIEKFEPDSTDDTDLLDLDRDGKLRIVYIQVDDSIIAQPAGSGQTDTDRVTAYLADSRSAPAYALCP